jgi:hypothetical protein
MKLEIESADDLLRAAREQAEPDADEGRRVLRRVQARLSSPSPRPPGSAVSVASRRALVSSRQRSWGTAAAAVTIFAAGFVLGRVSLEGAAPSLPSAPERTLPGPAALPPPVAAPAVESAPSPATLPPSLPSRPQNDGSPGVSAASPAARVPPRAPPRATASDASALQQALQYLRRAQAALREREPMRALAIIDDLDRRVPAAVLMEERQMTRVLAHCQGGQVDDARQIARALVAQHPDSVYLTRLQDACVPDVAADALERARRAP